MLGLNSLGFPHRTNMYFVFLLFMGESACAKQPHKQGVGRPKDITQKGN